MVPVIQVFSLLVFSKLFSCTSSLEEAYFWDDSHAAQFDAAQFQFLGNLLIAYAIFM